MKHTVIGNDVDTTELLHEHDEEGRLRGTTIALDGEEFLEQILALTFGLLDFEKLVSVVHVACGLDLVLSQAAESLEGFVVLALLHVPIRC